MTTPTVVLPQIIVEAGMTPAGPVQTGTSLVLGDATNGKLDTGTLGSGDIWSDISANVLNLTVTRPSSRLMGPLFQFQPGTLQVTVDNSGGTVDPDNAAGPFFGQIQAMVPLRARAIWNGTSYPLVKVFADAWAESAVSYDAGYSEWTVSGTDAFKILSGRNLATGASVGGGEDTGARISRLLDLAGWYTGAGMGARDLDVGDSTLQATTLGDTALNLMQVAADSEAGQLYVDPTGAVVFRHRRALLTDTRSNTSQASFGDLPNLNLLALGPGGWTGAGNCNTSAPSPTGVTMTSVAAGNMSAASCLASNITTQGLPCVPGQQIAVAALLTAAATPETCQAAGGFYNSGGTFLSNVTGATGGDITGAATQVAGQATAPASAAWCRLVVTVQGTAAGGEVHTVIGASLGPAELAVATVARMDDDTTIGNDIQATRVGGTLQEVQDATSIATYLFPRTYSRTDLLLQDDATALQWAGWVLYIAKTGEDRFDSVTIDPAADPVNLWPQVLGRDIGDRITVIRRPPPSLSTPVQRDCFITGITHTFDATTSAWSTTWTLADASKYGSFLTLNNATLGQLNNNSLAY